MESPSTPFSGWALVEQMGHKSIAGYVREQLVAGVPLLRVDVPGPDGSTEPIATQFIHASTLYALTPMAEAMVRKVAARIRVEPSATWGVDRALPPADDFDDVEEDDEDDPAKVVDDLLVNHGLAGVLEFLIQNYQDVAEPDSDRYTAILEHAKELVDRDHAWPERTLPAVEEPPTLVPGDDLIPPPATTPIAVGAIDDEINF